MPRLEDNYLEKFRIYLSIKQFMVVAFIILTILIPWIFWVDYKTNQTIGPLIGFIVLLIAFLLILSVFSYLLILDLIQWNYLENTSCERYNILDSEMTHAIENVLQRNRVDFDRMRSIGRLPDRFFHDSLGLFYEIFTIPVNDMKIIVSRSIGPPDERFTRVLFGPIQPTGTNSFRSIKLDIVAVLMEMES